MYILSPMPITARALLAKATPYLRIAKKAAEHLPERKDGPIAVAVKLMAIADVIREQGANDTGYWRKLRDERSLSQQESETFVSLFFGTALRDAFEMRRKKVDEHTSVIEADLGGGQSIIFRETSWGSQPKVQDDFLLSPGADMAGMINRLWSAYPSGIYVSMEVGEYGYGHTTSIAEITVPKMVAASEQSRALLKSNIETQYRVAHAGQHRTYLCYGEAGTGKSSFAVAFAKGCGGRVLQFDSTALPLIGVKELGFLLDTLKPSALILNDIDRAPVEKIGPRLLYLFETLKSQHPDVPLVLTCNDPGKLDSALLRPGRIDKSIEFKLPDLAERKQLVVALAEQHSIVLLLGQADYIAAETDGLSHAYIAHLVEAMAHEPAAMVLADMKALRALAVPVKKADEIQIVKAPG